MNTGFLDAEVARFDSQQMPAPIPCYVCWLDMVGASSAMKLSLHRAANFFAKIHVAGQRANAGGNVNVYPAIDGVYAIAARKSDMTDFLRAALIVLSQTFLEEGDQFKRFFVRCGLAFGPVVKGTDMAKGATELTKNAAYSSALAVGIAISHAYEAEKSAPFFGVFVHESARAFAPSGDEVFNCALWHWLSLTDRKERTYAKKLGEGLVKYFDWVETHSAATLFPLDKLKSYRALAGEYFA